MQPGENLVGAKQVQATLTQRLLTLRVIAGDPHGSIVDTRIMSVNVKTLIFTLTVTTTSSAQ